MATDPQSLLASASCFSCFGSDRGTMELLKLALLRQLVMASNPMAVLDPQTLLSEANCLSCFGSSPAQMQLMELALLSQIAAGGGTGGGGTGPLFTSALLPLTTTVYAVPHGLTGTPSSVRAVLVCIANDISSQYVLGDEVEVESFTEPNIGSVMFSLGSNPTFLFGTTPGVIPVGNEPSFLVPSKSGAVAATATSFNNFRLKFYARL